MTCSTALERQLCALCVAFLVGLPLACSNRAPPRQNPPTQSVPESRAAKKVHRFETLFTQALSTRGAEYQQARDAILAEPSSADLLRARTADADWHVALLAEILLGWLTQRELFTQCVQYLDGNLPGTPRNITGKFTLKQHIAALTKLGPAISPCLLETLLKRRPLDADVAARAFGTLEVLGHRHLKAASLELLKDENVNVSVSAASALAHFPEPDVTAALLSVLRDPAQGEWRRIAAAGAVAQHPSSEVTPTLHEFVADEATPMPVRSACLNAVVERKDTSAVPVIIAAAKKSNSPQFQLEAVSALGRLRDRAAIPFVQSMTTHPDELVRESAQDALGALR